MSFGGAFPGMGAVPGAQPQQSAGGGFVLNIPADPTWEPIESTDTLEMDGYYMLRIRSEKARTEGNRGVFITFDVMDADATGRSLSKFMPDSSTHKKDTWFVWRGLFRSITGTLDQARAAFQYTPGMLVNQLAYARTKAYNDDGGSMRTGVDAFVTKTEYDQAVAAKKHRWPAKTPVAGAGVVGSLPGGLPSAFPGMGGMGLPGAPLSPLTGMVPPPAAAAPMQQAPQGFPAPPTTTPQQQMPFQAPAATGVPSTTHAFAFPPTATIPAAAQQAAPQAPAVFAFPAPPNGTPQAPQPGAAQAFPFPPAPGS